mgnify:CR=1 FL=1
MKLRCVLLGLFIMMIILTPTALAVKEQEIADGWYSYNSIFDKGEYTYEIRSFGLENEGDGSEDGYEDGNILIKRTHPDELELKAILPYDSCEENVDRRWCFLNASYDSEKVDIDPAGQLQPAVKIFL